MFRSRHSARRASGSALRLAFGEAPIIDPGSRAPRSASGLAGAALRRPWIALLVASAALAGCERDEPRPRTLPLPVQILADTSSRQALSVDPPATARVWVARVTPASEPRPALVAPAPPAGTGPPLPEATADSLVAPPAAPALEIDSDLEPPILRRAARLVIPAGWRARGGAPRSVELDLLIEESGEVTQVEWAGGSEDSALVEAATRSAMDMRFLPALRRGHPIAVWSRQRFDFGRR